MSLPINGLFSAQDVLSLDAIKNDPDVDDEVRVLLQKMERAILIAQQVECALLDEVEYLKSEAETSDEDYLVSNEEFESLQEEVTTFEGKLRESEQREKDLALSLQKANDEIRRLQDLAVKSTSGIQVGAF